MHGIVIKSIPGALWRVRWECCDRTSYHKTMKEDGKDKVEEFSALDVERNYLGDADKLRLYSESRSNDF